jgi:hypothetical protein
VFCGQRPQNTHYTLFGLLAGRIEKKGDFEKALLLYCCP